MTLCLSLKAVITILKCIDHTRNSNTKYSFYPGYQICKNYVTFFKENTFDIQNYTSISIDLY